MAMTATIDVSPATCEVNFPLVATVTISNSGGSAINVTSITLNSKLTGAPSNDYAACALGQPFLGGGATISVPASGSLTFKMGVVFFRDSGSTTYDVGAICTSSDGSVFSPTADTVTVSTYVA